MAISTIAGVGAGSSGTILTTGVPQSGGVIQVVQAATYTQTGTSSTSLVTTGLSATITPKFSTSKVLVMLVGSCDTSNSNAMCGVTVYRGGTNLAVALGLTNLANNYGGSSRLITSVIINYLDSPATTSPTTYTPYFYNVPGSTAATVFFNAVGIQGAMTTLTLMEIAA